MQRCLALVRVPPVVRGHRALFRRRRPCCLPFSVRRFSVLSHDDASVSADDRPRRWSLQTLADLGSQHRHLLHPDVSELLLTDVTARLANQQQVCQAIRSSSVAIRDGTTAAAAVKEEEDASQDTPGIIRTSKFIAPAWWKNPHPHNPPAAAVTTADDAIRIQDCNQALKRLESVDVMHAGTHALCYKLLQQVQRSKQANVDNNLQYVVAATMKQVNARYAPTVETLAELAIGLRRYNTATTNTATTTTTDTNKALSSSQSPSPLHSAMDAFFRGRFGVQLLCNHYVALDKGRKATGEVAMDCSIRDVVDDAVTEAKHLCEAHFSSSPAVVIDESTVDSATAAVIRPWLTFTLVELLKNAMSVSVQGSELLATDYYTDEDDINHPPIHINVEHEDGYMLIHIHDLGGGLPTGVLPSSLFSFAQTDKLWDRMDDQTTYAMTRSPLRGLGAGLFLSRLTMQHFGGTVGLQNRHDNSSKQVGCTATVRLNLDTSQPERLVAGECQAMRLEMDETMRDSFVGQHDTFGQRFL